MKRVVVLVALVILGCTSIRQPAPPPQSEFKNLQVLPHTLTRPELVGIMRSFTRGLGVKCDHCHVVVATEPKMEFDFPNDAKETKRAARIMIQTVQALNRDFIPRVEAAAGGAPVPGEMYVTCWTCHRGQAEPEKPAPVGE